jgi:Domain of unknown function (DUF4956)
MPEWLSSGSEGSGPLLSPVFGPISPIAMALRLVVALACGWCVAWFYRSSHGRDQRDNRTLSTTLVLLAVLIAMVSMVIGDSVAKAFALVGALSIVRFRTVVDDTRDTAFVIFAVIVGMAAGAEAFLVPLIGIPLVGLAAIGMSRRPVAPVRNGNGLRSDRLRLLSVKLALGSDPETTLGAAFGQLTSERILIGTSTARQGTALEVTYEVRLHPDINELTVVNTLSRLDGVVAVELRKL